jgi:hypothetical protein
LEHWDKVVLFYKHWASGDLSKVSYTGAGGGGGGGFTN